MSIFWFDIIGTMGVALIIAAYALLQLKRLESSSLTYSILNGLGALLVIYSLYFDFNFSAFVVEFFWLLISLYGIGNYIFKKN